jgi:hypothetical protein
MPPPDPTPLDIVLAAGAQAKDPLVRDWFVAMLERGERGHFQLPPKQPTARAGPRQRKRSGG